MTQKNGLLSGKVSLITGASSGIGAATAKVFAAEGATVVLAARRVDRLEALVTEIRKTGAEASYTAMDVSRDEDVKRAVEFTVEKYGRLDLAFNNAGIGCDQEPMHLMRQNAFDEIMEINVGGVWHCLQHQISAMLRCGAGGAIVNNSSVGGLQAIPAGAPYVASKHAVIGLTRAAAAEYAQRGIRVNAVAPGTTRTEIIAGWFERNPGLEEQLHQATPQSRTAEPEEIAQAVAWLCSDRSSFVTGTVMPVDGGYTLV
ncbi:glucose 1-dehydrogenase [Streptomyces sp. NPDC001793]|uniref:SDR family NAD(P)-dependent oxidoreductase n=1 Tax=Streptomyces sp. NPDC001793 TaxID=3154657 RepID=UPI00331A664C